MSTHKLCDVCNRIIYQDQSSAVMEIAITNRYAQDQRKQHYDICKGCDMKLAEALLKLLPKLAYGIEPNVGIKVE